MLSHLAHVLQFLCFVTSLRIQESASDLALLCDFSSSGFTLSLLKICNRHDDTPSIYDAKSHSNVGSKILSRRVSGDTKLRKGITRTKWESMIIIFCAAKILGQLWWMLAVDGTHQSRQPTHQITLCVRDCCTTLAVKFHIVCQQSDNWMARFKIWSLDSG